VAGLAALERRCAHRAAPRDPANRARIKPEALWEYDEGQHLTGMQTVQACSERTAFHTQMLKLFERFDVLALPTAQVWPFDAELRWPKAIAGRPMDTYHRWMEAVIYATFAGLPCISMPVGFGAAGLPMGVQLIGRPHGDLALLQFAHAFERPAGERAPLRRQGRTGHRRQQRHGPRGRARPRRRGREGRDLGPQRRQPARRDRRARRAAHGVVADVAKLDDIDRLVAATAAFGGGRLDVLFANAGAALFRPIAETTEAQWDSVMDVNLKGVYFTCQKAAAADGRRRGDRAECRRSRPARAIRRARSTARARPACARSAAPSRPSSRRAASASMSSVPGPIETPLFGRDGLIAGGAVDTMKAAWAERNPMKRFGTPDEVAAAVLFLASIDASYITGIDLLVDGGVGSV
jgi:NAD(P)-dependent dehydrogenase (short-subunit alcohol dehydrogenase family)